MNAVPGPMGRVMRSRLLCGGVGAVLAGFASVASAVPVVIFSTQTLDVSSTATGSEILNTGTLIEANHVGANGVLPVTLDNGLTFGISQTSLINPNGGFNYPVTESNPSVSGWLHNSANNRGYDNILNSGFKGLMSSQWWIAYSASISDLEIGGLTIGHEYRLQLISENTAGGTVAVEGSDPYRWEGTASNANQLLSATWVAEDTTLNMRLSRWAPNLPGSLAGQGGEIFFNGYALHTVAVPEPSILVLLACGVPALLLGVRRRRA